MPPEALRHSTSWLHALAFGREFRGCAYSLIDNVVRGQAYPPMLLQAGLHDSRVGYWEPAKHTQRLREAAAGGTGACVLFKCELDEGHTGATDRACPPAACPPACTLLRSRGRPCPRGPSRAPLARRPRALTPPPTRRPGYKYLRNRAVELAWARDAVRVPV